MKSFELLGQYRQAFFDGFLVTFQLLMLTAVGGTIIGVCLEWLCEYFETNIRRIVDGIAFCVSAIPALVILFWLHYPAQALVGVVISPFWTALTTLMVINIFGVYRIVADSVKEFPSMLPLLSSPFLHIFSPAFSERGITSSRAVWRLWLTPRSRLTQVLAPVPAQTRSIPIDLFPRLR